MAKEYGDTKFGEINSNAFTQFMDSFNNYFNSEDPNEKNDILKKFGLFKFGEINNLLLSDFERALNRFLYIN